jgi:hypothetical protein
MPFTTDKLTLGSPFFDKRVKLIPCQKLKVQMMYDTGDWSIRALAKAFRVDRGLIRRIVDPEYDTRMKELMSIRQKDGRYYDKNTHNEQMKRHRKDKSDLLGSFNPELKGYHRKINTYESQEAREAHQKCVIVMINKKTIDLVATYYQRSGGLKAIATGKVPADATLTTWRKLRLYRDTHPGITINFEL